MVLSCNETYCVHNYNRNEQFLDYNDDVGVQLSQYYMTCTCVFVPPAMSDIQNNFYAFSIRN